MRAEDRDADHLAQILDLIAHIERRLDGMGVERFTTDRDEVDLTAYRLASIGEATHRLSDGLKTRHPEIPWRAIHGIRHVIAHDYGSVIPERIWNVTAHHLSALQVVCREELARIGG